MHLVGPRKKKPRRGRFVAEGPGRKLGRRRGPGRSRPAVSTEPGTPGRCERTPPRTAGVARSDQRRILRLASRARSRLRSTVWRRRGHDPAVAHVLPETRAVDAVGLGLRREHESSPGAIAPRSGCEYFSTVATTLTLPCPSRDRQFPGRLQPPLQVAREVGSGCGTDSAAAGSLWWFCAVACQAAPDFAAERVSADARSGGLGAGRRRPPRASLRRRRQARRADLRVRGRWAAGRRLGGAARRRPRRLFPPAPAAPHRA